MPNPLVSLGPITSDTVVDVPAVISGSDSLADVAVRLMALGSDLLDLRAQGSRLAFEVGPDGRLLLEREPA